MKIQTYLGVQIDTNRDKLLSEQAEKLLTEYYCRPDETSPQMAFARAANAYSYGDKKLAQRIYDGASKGWFMFASPVLSNAPKPREKVKALPISCFLTYVPDSLEGLIDHSAELRWLSVKGGGVGGHWSSVRSVSDIAPGPIPFLHTVDADMIAYRQGKTRKGSYAAYMNISHPDIMEFLQIRIPTGDVGRKCLNIHHAVNVTDEFMTAVEEGKDWNLLDPNDKSVRETMPARKLRELVLETRFRTGEPYINFIDTANHALPQTMKDKGLKINRIRAFIEQEQNERNISKKQREQLETILLTACRGNKLNKLSDVNYDIESGVIISLKLLDYSEEKGYSLRTPETKVTRTTGKSRSNIERFIKR